MNWKASQLFWKLQSQPFSNYVLWHVPRSFIEGNVSSLPKTLGKLYNIPSQTSQWCRWGFLKSWCSDIWLPFFISLFSKFNHRLAFFFFARNSYSHLTGCCIFMEFSFGYIAPVHIYFSEIWVLRSCPATDIGYSQQFPSFFHTNFLKFAPMSYRVIDLSGQVSEGRNNGGWMGGTLGRKRALNSEKSEFTSWLRLMA